MEQSDTYRVLITFPKAQLQAVGETLKFDGEREVRLELERIRRRLGGVLGGDVQTEESADSWHVIIRLFSPSAAWRNILVLLNNRTSFEYFEVPEVLLRQDTPRDYKLEFMRGFADLAGNIRPSNRDRQGLHRVRLDVLNHKANWKVPVQLCQLLQEHLGVAVPHIIWGHPNLGRAWREHQIDVYAEEFEKVGFSFSFKQRVLVELATLNRRRGITAPKGCPGQRERRHPDKETSSEESNSDHLPPELVDRHFDAYWEICRALGCPKRPFAGQQLAPELDE